MALDREAAHDVVDDNVDLLLLFGILALLAAIDSVGVGDGLGRSVPGRGGRGGSRHFDLSETVCVVGAGAGER